MLRKLMIAAALLTASGTALAHDRHGYGRVVTVEPQFVVSFGTRHHDGFRVLYETGGQRYWTHTTYRPAHTIVLPPHHRAHHVHHYGGSRNNWDDRRDWHDRRDWRDDRRDHRHEQRHDRHGHRHHNHG